MTLDDVKGNPWVLLAALLVGQGAMQYGGPDRKVADAVAQLATEVGKLQVSIEGMRDTNRSFMASEWPILKEKVHANTSRLDERGPIIEMLGRRVEQLEQSLRP